MQVEELLTSYLRDVGITEEQFVLACEAGSTCNDQTKVADRVSSKEQGCYRVLGAVMFQIFGNLNLETLVDQSGLCNFLQSMNL